MSNLTYECKTTFSCYGIDWLISQTNYGWRSKCLKCGEVFLAKTKDQIQEPMAQHTASHVKGAK